MSEQLNPAQTRAVQEATSTGLGLEIQRAGMMTLWAGSVGTIPAGWLQCNGQAVGRKSYLRLFTAIGVVFGVGDGATTFNVPTLAGPVAGTVWVIRT